MFVGKREGSHRDRVSVTAESIHDSKQGKIHRVARFVGKKTWASNGRSSYFFRSFGFRSTSVTCSRSNQFLKYISLDRAGL